MEQNESALFHVPEVRGSKPRIPEDTDRIYLSLGTLDAAMQ